MYKRISTLVVIGVSVLFALGLGTSFFLYQKLQQRVDAATAERLLLNQTRVQVREAQVAYMMMAQQVTDLLLDPVPEKAFDEKRWRKQQARENATAHIGTALSATQNMELKVTLRKLMDHNRQVTGPLGDAILWLATTNLDAAKNSYWDKYLPAQKENMALINEAIRFSSDELSGFNDKANEASSQAQFVSRVAIILFACLGLGIAMFLGQSVTRLIRLTEKAAREKEEMMDLRRDLMAGQLAEKLIFEEKERLRVTLSCIGDAVITTDISGKVIYLNPVAEIMTGWTSHEAHGLPLPDVFHIVNSETNETAPNPVERVLQEEQAVGLALHTVLMQRGGETFPIEDSAAPIRDQHDEIIGAVLVFHDVTHAQKMAKEMTYQASHDALTGLINRREFERRLEHALMTGKQDAKQHTLLYLDLDQFKIVNDTCGHMAGDELLKQLTSVLQTRLRRTDTLARLGGDEFGVLLESCPTKPALGVADLLLQTVREFHFVRKDKVFQLGLSIGLVTFSDGNETLTDILRMADAACYLAKDKGRNRVQIYTPEDTGFAQRRGEMGWVWRIQKALKEDRFVLYSQKILQLKNGFEQGEHYELLLRMKNEDGTLVPPMAFIPAAERYGLMPQLDRWVITTAFAQYIQRHPAGEPVGTCAINLSGASICDENFYGFVMEQFDRSKVPPSGICFEITETSAIANLKQAAELIRKLREHGCRFSLDDFGSGMSSFTYLKHLSVDYLKIDGGFVKDMIEDPIDRAMVEAINHIGHVMHIETIAEFVENDAILGALRKIGVDYAQGYGIEKPCLCDLPHSDFRD